MGPDQIYDSVIVGAGLSGLVAGYELAAAGAAMCILEANDHPGGRVRTIRYGPIYAEAGGMIVTDEDTAALQLLRDLSIGLSPPWGRHGSEMFLGDQIVRIDSGRGPADAAGLVKYLRATSSEPADQASRLEAELVTAYKEAMREIDRQSSSIDFPYSPDLLDKWDTICFGEFLDSFHPMLRAYFDLQLKATAGASVDQMSLFWGIVCTQWNLVNNFYAIEGGSDRLPMELVDRLHKDINLSARVRSVKSVDPDTLNVLYVQNGVTKQIQTRTVIMATPPRAVLELVDDLDQKKAQALGKVSFGSYIPVHLRFKDRFWTDQIKTGYLNCANMVVADIVDATRDQDQPGGILICFIAGSDAARLIDAGDDQIINLVMCDLDKIFPGKAAEAVDAAVFKWPEAIPYLTPHYASVFEHLQRKQGNIYFCGDYTQGAGLNEAIYSGQIASREVIRDLGKRP